MTKFSVLFFVIFALLASCEDNSTDMSQPISFSGGVSYDGFWPSVNKPGQIGKIELQNSFVQSYDFSQEKINYTEDSWLASIRFFDAESYKDYNPAKGIEINETNFAVADAGADTYFAYGDNLKGEGLILNFGQNGNRFRNTLDKYISAFDTTLIFPDNIRFKNIFPGDRLNKNIALNVAWTGTGTEYVKISLNGAENSNAGYTGECYTENDGMFRISAEDMEKFPAGKYALSVMKFVPFWLTLNEADKIQLILEPEHEIDIYLK